MQPVHSDELGTLDGGPKDPQLLLDACRAGDLDLVRKLIDEQGEVWGEDKDCRGCLHYATQGRHLAIVDYLLTQAGCPWNTIDKFGRTAADTARENGDTAIYDSIVRAGLRAEYLLNLLERKEAKEEEEDQAHGDKIHVVNQEYLSSKLKYEQDQQGQLRLVDTDGNGVMMGWELEIMLKSAEILCKDHDSDIDVLNIGFGLGLIDTEIQKYKPKTHTIVEAHPDVIAEMKRQGWDKKPGVIIIQGRWQDVLDQLVQYDAIYADTFGEFYSDLRSFHEELPCLLKGPQSRYSFFHGLGADQQLFYDVYTQLVELDLKEIGLKTVWQNSIPITNSDNLTWNGIRKRYWTLSEYRLPLCHLV